MSIASLSLLLTLAVPQSIHFDAAQPVWLAGLETEMNIFAGFRAAFDAPADGSVILRSTGSTIYRVFLNGQFAGYGPARGPHGYYRVDEWDLTPYLKPGENWLAIETAGYNVNSYYLLDQPAFLQAEICANGEVVAATDTSGAFEAVLLSHRVQRVERYSFQRTFVEVYRQEAHVNAWRVGGPLPQPAELATTGEKKLLPRRIGYSRFVRRAPFSLVAKGTNQRVEPAPENMWRDRALVNISPTFKGFPEQDLDVTLSSDLQHFATLSLEPLTAQYDSREPLTIPAGNFQILDFGTNLCGFVGGTVTCSAPSRLYILFDEILQNHDVNWRRLSCVNAIQYDLQPGTHSLESFEPYVMRYAKLLVTEGECAVSDVFLREYTNPDVWEADFACSDFELNRIFEAGRETYRQNALDAFMDCPHRERAGWLCDSYFTARAGADLSGNTNLEKVFIENYLLPESFAHLPEGMLPMCYPADHPDGVFIPNWAMWFVLQLEEYLARSGDQTIVAAFEPRVMALIDYFEPFRNEDGLLEKLDSWVFVEWSAANQFVQDVNYPSNMLYASMLDTAGRLYKRQELNDEAARLREVIRAQSFDGEFFVDNALRTDAGLEVTQNRSEVCQYFAFYFDLATPGTHPELWEKLRDEFGPDRAETKLHADVHAANSFIGNMLRFELLSRYGEAEQIRHETTGYLMYMVNRTGTLWENVHAEASCNHGFASHIVHTLYRDMLGLRSVDLVGKRVEVVFQDVSLDWCQGRIPLGDGFINVSWEKDGGALRYHVAAPAGYDIQLQNNTGLELVSLR